MEFRHSHGIEVDGKVHFVNHAHEFHYTDHRHVFKQSGDFRMERTAYEKWVKSEGGVPAPLVSGKAG